MNIHQTTSSFPAKGTTVMYTRFVFFLVASASNREKEITFFSKNEGSGFLRYSRAFFLRTRNFSMVNAAAVLRNLSTGSMTTSGDCSFDWFNSNNGSLVL